MVRPDKYPAAAATANRVDEVVNPEDDKTECSEKPRSRQAKWAHRNPKARWAHLCLASALKRGLVERQACEVCGDARTDGHHDDYDRPMQVRWLCRKHHMALHSKAGRRDG